MIYKGFNSGVITYDTENKKYYGVVVNSADYVKFSSDTFNNIEAAFHDSIDKYIKTCEVIGKDPFLKKN